MASIQLRPVSLRDAVYLYRELAARDPSAAISHRTMPPFWKHLRFILSKPYAVWYMIRLHGKRVGSIYLTRADEVGIFIEKDRQGQGIASQAFGLLALRHPRSRYLANIAPGNIASQAFFSRQGFEIIQYTYQLEV